MPWRWPWAPELPAEPPRLLERLAELESRLDFLEEDHTKLRGRVTGGLRKPKEEPPPPPEPEVPNNNGVIAARLRQRRGF